MVDTERMRRVLRRLPLPPDVPGPFDPPPGPPGPMPPGPPPPGPPPEPGVEELLRREDVLLCLCRRLGGKSPSLRRLAAQLQSQSRGRIRETERLGFLQTGDRPRRPGREEDCDARREGALALLRRIAREAGELTRCYAARAEAQSPGRRQAWQRLRRSAEESRRLAERTMGAIAK